MMIIRGSSKPHYLIRMCVFLVIAVLVAGMAGCIGDGSQNLTIQDWYDLDAIRDNLDGNHQLMNNLDSSTPGYEELASPTANEELGWQPIGTKDDAFTGSLDGQGYEIRDLFINRPDEGGLVGLFGYVGEGGSIKDVGVVNVNVTGHYFVGGLVGCSWNGTINNSYSTGSVTGDFGVGGLAGCSWNNTISNSYFIGSVTGHQVVGGLVGDSMWGDVNDSYSEGTVNGENDLAGGLLGSLADGVVTDSYYSGTVTGDIVVGGLLGSSWLATVNNCYSTGNVTGNHTVGGLVGGSGCSTVDKSYSSASVTGGLRVGGLVGMNGEDELAGTVRYSYAVGSVTGDDYVGGLVGFSMAGPVSNSYSTGKVTGNSNVGGLMGRNLGTVNSSFWDIETSGQATSDGGTGKNTTEMQDIATFSGIGWNIIAVAGPGTRNPSYVWNIVDDETYPFLSWQS